MNSVAVSSIGVAAAEDLVPALVEHHVGEAQDVARQVAVRPAQHCLHAGDELGERERLGDVVVAAGAQRLHLVLDRVLRGQEENRRLEAALAHPPPDLDPGDVRQHPVEHDEVRLLARHCRERVAAVRRLLDLIALVAQRRRDRVGDRRLVVDDENAAERLCSFLCHAFHVDPLVCDSPVKSGRSPVDRL